MVHGFIPADVLRVSFLFAARAQIQSHLVNVENEAVGETNLVHDECVLLPAVLILLLVLLHGGRLQVLVGVTHFSEVAGDDRSGKHAAVARVDVVAELNSREEGAVSQRQLNNPFDFHRFAVLPFLLQTCNQRTPFHFFISTILSVLMEDGRVAQLQLDAYLLQVVPWIFPIIFMCHVLPKDAVHLRQLLLGYCRSYLSILLSLHLHSPHLLLLHMVGLRVLWT